MTAPSPEHPPVFVDGLGARHLVRDEASGALVEHLVLDPELTEAPGFTVALGERVARLSGFRNTCYARVHHVEAIEAGGVGLVSDFTYGWRLAHVLDAARAEDVEIDTTAVLALLRQLLPAVALLSQQARDVVHGALGPERLVITPQGRVVVIEHVFGSALEALQYGRERLWRDFRVATPPSPGLPRMTPRTDAVQVGLITLALVLGRRLEANEFPDRLTTLVDEAGERLARTGEAAAPRLMNWIARALQLDARSAFQSPFDAQAALEHVLAGRPASNGSLDTLLARLAPALPPMVAPAPLTAEPEAPPVAVADVPPEPDAPEPVVPATAVDDEVALPAPPAAPPAVAPAPAPSTVVSSDAEAATPARRVSPALAALALIVLLQAGLIAWLWQREPAAPLSTTGELVVESRPEAARVSIDGEERGVTPFRLELAPGAYVLQVAVGGAEPRVIPLTIRAGVQTAQYVELVGVPTTGTLDVRSEPSRVRVWVDGQDRGLTPLTLNDLSPGEHEVVLERGAQRVTHRVRIEPGTTAQLVVPMR